MKQKWWFLPATVLVVFGLLTMGCPPGAKGPGGGDDREWKEVFDLDKHLRELKLEKDTTGKGEADGKYFFGKENAMITNAGDETTFTVIENDGKLGLKINTATFSWGAGLDLKYGGFKFYEGDEIVISGKVNSGDAWMVDYNAGAAEKAVGGKKFAGTFKETLELTAEEVASLEAAKPAGLRINCKTAGVEIEIWALTVSGNRPTGDVFDAVTDISGVPTSVYKDDPVTLKGAVVPDYATNKAIAWTLKTAGAGVTALTPVKDATDGSVTFTATEVGSFTVTATVADGKAKGEAFTKDFPIKVTDPVLVTIKVINVNQEVAVIPVGGSVEAVTGGYKFTRTEEYQGGYVYFEVDFGSADQLKTFNTVTLKYEAITGDVGYKRALLVASATEFSGSIKDADGRVTLQDWNAYTNAVAGKNMGAWDVGPQVTGSGAGTENVTFKIDNLTQAAVDGRGSAWVDGDPGSATPVPKGEKLAEKFTTQKVYFSVYCGMSDTGDVGGSNSPTVISITDIAFVK